MPSYWSLKTIAGFHGPSQWPMFVQENVVGIGWEDIPIDPAAACNSALLSALATHYPTENPAIAAGKIRDFIDLALGARIDL